MKILKIVGILVGLVVVVVGGALIYVSTLDADAFLTELKVAVKDETGRDLVVAGPADLSISLTPTLSVSDVTFSNAEWAKETDMLKVGLLELEVSLIPLLSDQVDIGRLTLKDVDVNLEIDKSGKPNWDFGDGEDQKPEASSDDTQDFLHSITIRKTNLENVNLSFINQVTGANRNLNIRELSVSGSSPTNPLDVTLDLDLDKQTVALKGKLPSPRSILARSDNMPVDVTGQVAGHDVSFKGMISLDDKDGTLQALHLTKFDAKLDDHAINGDFSLRQLGERPSLSGDLKTEKIDVDKLLASIEGVSAIAGPSDSKDKPAEKPAAKSDELIPSEMLKIADADIKFSAKEIAQGEYSVADLVTHTVLKGGDLDLKIMSFDLTAKGEKIGGSGAVKVFKGRPDVTLKLKGDKVDLAKLIDEEEAKAEEKPKPAATSQDSTVDGGPESDGPQAGAVVKPAAKPRDPDDPLDKPFPVDLMRKADGLITLELANLVKGKVKVNDINAKVEMRGGKLTIHPSKANFSGGDFDLQGVFDASKATPTVQSDLAWKGVDFGALAQEFADLDLLEFKGDSSGSYTGAGKTPREVLASLNGVHWMVVPKGKIKNDYWKLIAADLVKKITEIGKEETGEFNCFVQRHEITNGIAEAKVLMLDSDQVTVSGEGTIDLGELYLDMKISPNPRDASLFSLSTPVLVMGPVDSPTILPDPAALAKTAGTIALGVTVNPFIFAAPFLDEGSDEPPCEQAIIAAKTGKMPKKTEKKGNAVTNTLNAIIPGVAGGGSSSEGSTDEQPKEESGGSSNPVGNLFNSLKKLGN